MNVEDDVWACAYVFLDANDKGESVVDLGCFMVRADYHSEALVKAREFVGQLAARRGKKHWHAVVNDVPGERAVVDLENGAYSSRAEGVKHRYEVKFGGSR